MDAATRAFRKERTTGAVQATLREVKVRNVAWRGFHMFGEGVSILMLVKSSKSTGAPAKALHSVFNAASRGSMVPVESLTEISNMKWSTLLGEQGEMRNETPWISKPEGLLVMTRSHENRWTMCLRDSRKMRDLILAPTTGMLTRTLTKNMVRFWAMGVDCLQDRAGKVIRAFETDLPKVG